MSPFTHARLYTFVDTACLGGRDPAELSPAPCATAARKLASVRVR